MKTKTLILLLIFLSCNKAKETEIIRAVNLPPPPPKENITWIKTSKNTLELDKSLSHNRGFECDSVIGIDYVGFEGEHFFYPINDKGEFISSIKKKQKLNKKQFLKLNSILGNKETYKNPQIIGCYEPRLAFIYYRKNKVVGQTQICLSCAQLHSTIETVNGEYGSDFNKKALEELDDLRIDLGFSNNP
jgi:hypothetical protein